MFPGSYGTIVQCLCQNVVSEDSFGVKDRQKPDEPIWKQLLVKCTKDPSGDDPDLKALEKLWGQRHSSGRFYRTEHLMGYGRKTYATKKTLNTI